MNLRFIEAFVWVARLRSFTAAAEKLYTTQAAISARIATLESDFGVKLFERDNRTVTLTHSGEDLLRYAEQLLGISARMLEAVSDRATYGGFIAVGVITGDISIELTQGTFLTSFDISALDSLTCPTAGSSLRVESAPQIWRRVSPVLHSARARVF